MITKDNNFKVMKLFFDNPEKTFHIREIARKTGLSTPGVIKIVKRLKKEKLLVSHKGKVTEEVGAHLEGRFMMMKKVYNIYNVLESGLVDMLKDFYEEPKAIILFGSYADGTDTSTSDIDVCVVTKNENMPNTHSFERKLHHPISLYPLNVKKVSPAFRNSLANGIVLDGFAEVA
jgi:predicted nucleotidyltransferase